MKKSMPQFVLNLWIQKMRSWGINIWPAFFVDFTTYTQARINAFQYFFWSQRIKAAIKKKHQRGFPLHFISFKMTANQETQVNASILSKTLQEYSILYAMTFLRNLFSRVDHHMSKNALFGKFSTCILPLWIATLDFLSWRSHLTTDYSVSCF